MESIESLESIINVLPFVDYDHPHLTLSVIIHNPIIKLKTMKPLQKLLLALLLLSNESFAEELKGKVINVADGDTITVLATNNTPTTIRLSQIDAPEKKQAFGSASKKNLSDLVYGKVVTVSYSEKDRYGRIIGQVAFDGLDVNLKQITMGYAWVYRQYSKNEFYLEAENRARNNRIGLWDDRTAVAPWDFRKGKFTPSPTDAILPTTLNTTPIICGTKRFCKEMLSCDEATHYLTKCGLSKLDSDGDGEPCEKLCKSQ